MTLQEAHSLSVLFYASSALLPANKWIKCMLE